MILPSIQVAFRSSDRRGEAIRESKICTRYPLANCPSFILAPTGHLGPFVSVPYLV